MKLIMDGDAFVYRSAVRCQETLYIVDHDTDNPLVYPLISRAKAFEKKRGEKSNVVAKSSILPGKVPAKILDSYIKFWTNLVGTKDYVLHFSGEENFRYVVDPNYKKGRTEKPIYYEGLKDYVLKNHPCFIAENMEADDSMGIEQTRCREAGKQSVIVTNDKDLRQVPGNFCNSVTPYAWYKITDPGSYNGFGTGFAWFCAQMITGDTVDKIKGIPGAGPARAKKILKGKTTMRQMWTAVAEEYIRKELTHTLWDQAHLLWIRRHEDESVMSFVYDRMGDS